jgi:hypothetical protein
MKKSQAVIHGAVKVAVGTIQVSRCITLAKDAKIVGSIK